MRCEAGDEFAGQREFPQRVGLRRAAGNDFDRRRCEFANLTRDIEAMARPGGIPWQAISFKNGIYTTPRATLRWVPTDDREIPEIFATSGAEESEPEA